MRLGRFSVIQDEVLSLRHEIQIEGEAILAGVTRNRANAVRGYHETCRCGADNLLPRAEALLAAGDSVEQLDQFEQRFRREVKAGHRG